MIIVEKILVRDIDVSVATCFWNSWDHEHLYYVHDNFVKANIIHEDPNVAALLTTVRIPFFRFLHSTGIHVMVRTNETTTKVINIGLFGIPSILTMKLDSLSPDSTRLTNEYKFILKGWRMIFAPVLRVMIQRWNDGNWAEDAPLKERRQKVLRLGFKDYAGLPEKIEDRVNQGDIELPRLPIRRFKESILNELL